MQRAFIDFIGRRQLNHMSKIHDRDPVGYMAHDQEVMGDKQVGQAQLVLQFIEHIDDLRLD